LDDFKKTDKQDGGHCAAYKEKTVQYAMDLQDWKAAESAAASMVEDAHCATSLALAHYQFGIVLMRHASIKDERQGFLVAHTTNSAKLWQPRLIFPATYSPMDLPWHN
jgi:hypothetical protein